MTRGIARATVVEQGYLRCLSSLYLRREVCRGLIACKHIRTHTAVSLGVARRTLLNYISEFGLRTRIDIERYASDDDEMLRDAARLAYPEPTLPSATVDVVEAQEAAS